MKNVDDLNKNFCTGCATCYSICPVKAIEMKENIKGFLEPIIDYEKCINCGLCAKRCPQLVSKEKNETLWINHYKCFAVMADDKTRLKSASGGVFAMLARHFLDIGGYVAGAIFDENLKVKHVVSNKIEDIEKMKDSKYIQSSIGNCYNKIKELLENGKKVLFSGTPCQIAGLRIFLQRKYNNLFCVDVICHGIPSQKVFDKYIDENFEKDEIKSFKFRDKQIKGWSQGNCLSVTLNGKPVKNNDYFYLFINNFILRESCFSCSFAKFPRQGDLTIGDLWGKENRKNNDNLGTSVVIFNNQKGKALFKILKASKYCKKVSLKRVIKGNPNLVKPTKKPKNYDLFWQNYDKLSLQENKLVCLENKSDCLITNFWFAMNYGAILTCFGVQCLMEKMGLQTKIVNFVPENWKSNYKNSFSEKFANKYLHLSNECNNFDDLYKLNENCKIFVTGSDQVFNKDLNKTHSQNSSDYLYLLDFVKSKNLKLSYSASIGKMDFDKWSAEDILLYEYYLKQFDGISVRENINVDILKSRFDIDAICLIDGAFHIPKEFLQEVTKDYKYEEDYILSFCLPWQTEPCSFTILEEKLSQKFNLPIKKIVFDTTKPVEEWLSLIKNAKFVISDSFHAVVFSILFNVPFVQIIVNYEVQSRLESLFEILKIKNNSIFAYQSEIDLDEVLQDYNWTEINNIIEQEKIKAENWVKESIKKIPKVDSRLDVQNHLLSTKRIKKKNVKKIFFIKCRESEKHFIYKFLGIRIKVKK